MRLNGIVLLGSLLLAQTLGADTWGSLNKSLAICTLKKALGAEPWNCRVICTQRE